MSLIFVFSGTSEGRELIETLADRGCTIRAFVATEYGQIVMKEHENITVNIGRLDEPDIRKLIKNDEPDYIVDATHPHAKVITENIKMACRECGLLDKYIRVLREESGMQDEGFSDCIIKVSSYDEAILKLSEFPEKKIMITTGVKELSNFAKPDLIDRLVVRILPGRESLEIAYNLGFSTRQIIAMEGPFSINMNSALIREYDVAALVTKNSGTRGGYLEKIKACKENGIKAIVIENESDDKGISINEAVKTICKDAVKNVCIIGAGVCNKEYLTRAAYEAIKNAKVIIGAKRMAEFGRSINNGAIIYEEYEAKKVSSIINESDEYSIAVLMSGDTGLCSGSKGLIRELNDKLENVKVDVIPGISSISYMAAKLKLQYSDYPFISLHEAECEYMKYINSGEGFIAICSGVEDAKRVSRDVLNKQNVLSVYLGKNLGSDDEEIIGISNTCDIDSLSEGLYVIAVVRE